MKTRKSKILLSALFLGSCLTACSTSENNIVPEPTEPTVMISERVPIKLTPEQRVFVNDNNTFTLRFLNTVNKSDVGHQSFVFSPLSITYVLGMVNDAAEGTTSQEMEQVLGFHEGGAKAVNEFCKNLIYNLPKTDTNVKLNIANAIFINNKFKLQTQFQKDMKEYYDAEAESLDFSSSATADRINSWCNKKTNGMIPKILDDVNKDVVDYLVNAIYFKADWASKFDKQNTKEEPFTTANGQVQLPLMHQNVLINYQKNPLFSSVVIPYGNGLWNMTVMLPQVDKTVDDVIAYLAGTYEGDSIEEGYAYPHEVDLKIPRFETTSDTKDYLIDILRQMGIHQVFDSYFSEVPNMCTNNNGDDQNLYIQMMRQKAAIKVNEEGSEAAAVTIAGMYTTTSVDPVEYPRAVFHADRPFVYMIRESSSDVIVFVGKFMGK